MCLWFLRTAIKNCHQLGRLKWQKYIPTEFWRPGVCNQAICSSSRGSGGKSFWPPVSGSHRHPQLSRFAATSLQTASVFTSSLFSTCLLLCTSQIPLYVSVLLSVHPWVGLRDKCFVVKGTLGIFRSLVVSVVYHRAGLQDAEACGKLLTIRGKAYGVNIMVSKLKWCLVRWRCRDLMMVNRSWCLQSWDIRTAD